MSTIFDLMMYCIAFAAMAVLFASALTIALWLLKRAWRIVTWPLRIGEPR